MTRLATTMTMDGLGWPKIRKDDMTRIVAGILAHVDAGKTTLSEALLYRTGQIRKLGRVDHGDAFLDTETLEKRRGITIHAHQANITYGDMALTLLDTPGHVDFAAETERVLRVLDVAVLVVSGTDGVQGHTETLWRLLARYHVPTFLFVNKMDAPGVDREQLLVQLRRRFGDGVRVLPTIGMGDGDGVNGGDVNGGEVHGARPVDITSSHGGTIAVDGTASAKTASSPGSPSRSQSAPSRGTADAVLSPGDSIGESELEDIATLDESAMEEYLESGGISVARLQAMIAERTLFPVFFGSALRLEGIEDLLAGLAAYARAPQWPDTFGARVYKVSHDGQHNRLTWLKVTGGTLRAKAMLTNERGGTSSASAQPTPSEGEGEEIWRQKADQVRIYNGAKFEIATEVPAGCVCAVTGLTHTFPGQGLGMESDAESPTIQPVLTYTVLPEGTDVEALQRAERTAAQQRGGSTEQSQAADADRDGTDKTGKTDKNGNTTESADTADHADGNAEPATPSLPTFDDLTLHKVIAALRELEDEDPLLHVVWQEQLRELHVQLMGAVQLEIIQQVLHDRFGLDVEFGPGGILYRETVTEPIEGVGHFEPLRHYAEAHILIEPGEPGSGVRVASALSENVLDRNWQRLIMTHLRKKEHLGVLTGAPLTDVKLTLVAGRAHLKHTEGGDFRQATYRAVRQGLMELRVGVSGTPDGTLSDAEDVRAAMERGSGHCRLLEPWYAFRLEVPQDMLGRAMADIQRMAGTFDTPDSDGDYAVLTGECPVSTMRDYAMDVNAYTHGRGRLGCTFAGYHPCHDENRVVREARYNPEADLDNTPDSVFCAHGAGYPVKWYKVPEFAHVEYAG